MLLKNKNKTKFNQENCFIPALSCTAISKHWLDICCLILKKVKTRGDVCGTAGSKTDLQHQCWGERYKPQHVYRWRVFLPGGAFSSRNIICLHHVIEFPLRWLHHKKKKRKKKTPSEDSWRDKSNHRNVGLIHHKEL